MSDQKIFNIKILPETGYKSNSYILTIDSHVLLIDPSQPLPSGTPQPTAILCTHGHFDHICELNNFRKNHVPVYIAEEEAVFLADARYNLCTLFGVQTNFEPAEYEITNGAEVNFGDKLSIEWRRTEGHTPGSTCLLIYINGTAEALFSGDTLFMDSIGRTDFPGGDTKAMIRSLKKIFEWSDSLPYSLPIYPGHGPRTTLGRELQYNPYLNPKNGYI